MKKVLLTTFNSKYIHPNLALRWLYVARDFSYETEIKEFTINDDINKDLKEVAGKYDVIGISCYIWNIELVKEFVVKLHDLDAHVRIILGGPEVSFDVEDLLGLPIECVLKGEGEITFWQAVRKEANIDGYYSKDYKSRVLYARSDINYLETLELPYFINQGSNQYLYLETSRGCPYNCAYCLSSTDNIVRNFSLGYINKVLELLNENTCKQVKFLDRTFNTSPQRALTIAKKIASLQLPYSFQLEIVADTISDEMLDFFTKNDYAKYFRFEVGIQSFNQKTLESVNRFQKLDRLVEVITKLNNAGYTIHTDLIGGLPYEDILSFENSYNKLFLLRQSEIQTGLLKLLKGTSLRKNASKYKMVYEENAPYTIISNEWVSENDINDIKSVAFATERLYNRQRFKRSINYLIDNGYIKSPFIFMKEVGNKLKAIKQPQLLDQALIIYDICKDSFDHRKLEALILHDYYLLSNLRPKHLPFKTVPNDKKEVIINYLIDNYHIIPNTLYNYASIEYDLIDDSIGYQIHIYTKNIQHIYLKEEDVSK